MSVLRDVGRVAPRFSGPLVEIVLADADGEPAFAAEFSISDGVLRDSGYDITAKVARGAVLGELRMRCAGSLCAVRWPG